MPYPLCPGRSCWVCAGKGTPTTYLSPREIGWRKTSVRPYYWHFLPRWLKGLKRHAPFARLDRQTHPAGLTTGRAVAECGAGPAGRVVRVTVLAPGTAAGERGNHRALFRCVERLESWRRTDGVRPHIVDLAGRRDDRAIYGHPPEASPGGGGP